jgi:hypothetical protein
MNSSVPDGDGSPVYTKDVHTPQVARQPQCKLDFQVDSRQALSEHAYIQQSQRYIEEEHSVHLCTHVDIRAQLLYTKDVCTQRYIISLYTNTRFFGNAGKPSSRRAALCLDQVSNVHRHFIDLC